MVRQLVPNKVQTVAAASTRRRRCVDVFMDVLIWVLSLCVEIGQRRRPSF